MVKQLKLFGAPDEVIQSAVAREATADSFILLPDNVAAFSLFMAVATQWRTSINGIVGLDYGAVESALRMMGEPLDDPDRFQRLRLLESAALKVFRNQS